MVVVVAVALVLLAKQEQHSTLAVEAMVLRLQYLERLVITQAAVVVVLQVMSQLELGDLAAVAMDTKTITLLRPPQERLIQAGEEEDLGPAVLAS